MYTPHYYQNAQFYIPQLEVKSHLKVFLFEKNVDNTLVMKKDEAISIRRLQVQLETFSFNDLLGYFEKCGLQLENAVVRYLDDENDWIDCASEEEFKLAKQVFNQTHQQQARSGYNKHVMKIAILLDNHSEKKKFVIPHKNANTDLLNSIRHFSKQNLRAVPNHGERDVAGCPGPLYKYGREINVRRRAAEEQIKKDRRNHARNDLLNSIKHFSKNNLRNYARNELLSSIRHFSKQNLRLVPNHGERDVAGCPGPLYKYGREINVRRTAVEEQLKMDRHNHARNDLLNSIRNFSKNNLRDIEEQKEKPEVIVQSVQYEAPVVESPFKHQLIMLKDMGFLNEHLTVQLLQKYNGDMQQVIVELLNIQ